MIEVKTFIAKHRLALALLALGIPLIIGVATLKPKPEKKPQVEPTLLTVTTVAAEPKTWNLEVLTQGTVEPKREINLVAEVGGRIIATAPEFVSGGFAEADQMLIQIDPREYQFALTRAKARLADAQQLLATERGRARQAKREWRDLGNREANDLFLRKPQIASAEANLAAAHADLDDAALDVQRATITLPFSGRLRKTLVNLGQYVSPGTPLASAFDISTAEIRLSLTEKQAALIDLPLGISPTDTPTKVTLSGSVAGKQHQWQGTITRTDAAIDTRSRMYYAIAEVENPYQVNLNTPPLIMGLFVDASITGRAIDDVIRIPKSALFQSRYVYSLNLDQRVHINNVNVLSTTAQYAWIQVDLEHDSRIITDKQNFLTEGLHVAQHGNPIAVTVEP